MALLGWLTGRWPDAPIPLSIVTGPSLSGKTTFIERLVAHAPRDMSIGLIPNDSGHHGHDHDEHHAECGPVRRFACGCEGDKRHMKRTFAPIAKQHRPDLLVIETGGSEDCDDLLRRLREVERYVVVDMVCTVMSAVSAVFEIKKPEIVSQIEAANLVLLNDIDRADPEVIKASRSEVASRVTPGTPIFEAVKCEADMFPVVLAGARGNWRPEGTDACARHDVPLSDPARAAALIDAASGRFVRAKGTVDSQDGQSPRILNATARGIRWESATADDDGANAVSFYGHDLDTETLNREVSNV